MKIQGLTIQEKKAADHYLEYGQKANAIRHAYNIGKKGGSKTKELEKKVENLEKILELQRKTIEHDKKFGKYEMM